MISHYFIDRPIFATVLSFVIVIVGAVSLTQLPIAQYPDIAPPTISITTIYPGASAKIVAETVATPIEQEINGVENMLYMSSKCGNDGQMALDVTFKLGTDLDMAQVLVQNRVAIAQPKLPEEVRRQGVTVKKRSPNILLVVNLISPDKSKDAIELSNFAFLQVKDELARLEGVGDIATLGARDYSMRVWLDPEKLAARSITVGDVLAVVREQNVQVAAGRIGQPPTSEPLDFQFTVNTQGRLVDERQFGQIVVKTGEQGEIIHLSDVARIELGAKNYDVSSFLDNEPCALLAIFPTPGANAIDTAHLVKTRMKELSTRFPAGVAYRIVYDTTVFVEESIQDVVKTLVEAFVLVFIVVLVFLQSWRATILPMIEVPISLIGTFFLMQLFGFSLNNLSLFGLVLAIGIVVDDAIVVIENTERWMAKGLSPRDATRKAMEEVTGPIIATSLALCSVFVPVAFIPGISGEFYKQFALTIAASTVISTFNALTMTPARCALILKPHQPGSRREEILPRWGVAALAGGIATYFLYPLVMNTLGIERSSELDRNAVVLSLENWRPIAAWVVLFSVGAAAGWIGYRAFDRIMGIFLGGFNRVFDSITRVYGRMVSGFLRVGIVAIMLYAGILGLTALGFREVPVGFIPEQDQGYLVANVQLPEGASLSRTKEVVDRVNRICLGASPPGGGPGEGATPGIVHTVSIVGYSLFTSSNISNSATMFITLDGFEHRRSRDLSAPAIQQKLYREVAKIEDAMVLVFGAPPVQGIGNAGGFKMQIQDRGDLGLEALEGSVANVIEKGSAQPGLVGMFSSFRTNQPQLYLDIDRIKSKKLGVPLDEVFNALQGFLGSQYVNDLTRFGRNWQVNVQADAPFREKLKDIGKLRARSMTGEMVPLDTLCAIREVTGPALVNHYNLYPSAEVNGASLPGVSSGQAIAMMEVIADEELPKEMTGEWTELALQQKLAGSSAVFVFALGTVFVFLVLAAQYESWSLPLAVVLIVPMCLSAAIFGIWLVGYDNNIFTQIGFVVLIGLASKNAILIVEFAKQIQDTGKSRRESAIEASRIRLRPILMTSFAFILGVVPLVRAVGAGAEMRRALGVAVFSGMLGVTFLGIFLTPVFYDLVRGWLESEPKRVLTQAPSKSADEPSSPEISQS